MRRNKTKRNETKKNKTQKRRTSIGGNLRVLIFCSALAALAIVLSQYLSIKIGNSVRIGFGALPVILAGCLFGPVAGMLVGAVSDILGCILFYGVGALVPLVTVGVMVEGAVAGLVGRRKTPVSLVTAVMTGRIVGSALIKAVGLWLQYKTPLPVLLARIPPILLEGALISILLVYLLCNNRAVTKEIRGLTEK